jgi:hypothetical protein
MASRVNKIFFVSMTAIVFGLGVSGLSASEFDGTLSSEFNNFLAGTVVIPSPSPTTSTQVVIGGGATSVVTPSPTPKSKFSTFKGKISAKVLKVNPQDLDLDDSMSEIEGDFVGEVNNGVLEARVGTMSKLQYTTDQDGVVEESYILPGLEDENEFFRANILSGLLPSRIWELLAVAALSSLITWGAARQYYLVA